MAILLLWMLALQQPGDPCSERHEAAQQASTAAAGADAQARMAALALLAGSARDARLCYGRKSEEKVAVLLSWEAYALLESGRNALAEAVLDTFIVHYAAAGPPELSPYVRALRAGLYVLQGRYVDALRDYHEALVRTPTGDVLSRVELHLNTALAYQRVSDFSAAEAELHQVDRLLPALPEQDPWRAFMVARLGSQRADMILQRTVLTARLDVETLRLAESQALYAAETYRTLDLPAEAARALSQAAEARAFQRNTPGALEAAEHAVQLALQSGDPAAQVLVGYKQAQLTAAAGSFAPAKQQLERLFEDAGRLGRADLSYNIAFLIGSVSEAAGDKAEAERWLRRSIERIERQRLALGTSEWSALAFSEWQRPYRALVRILLSQGRVPEAFLMLERVRARRLTDLRRQARSFADLPEQARLTLDSLSAELRRVQSDVQREPVGTLRHAALQSREIRLIQAQDALFGNQPEQDSLQLEPVQRALASKQRVLLSYFIGAADPLFGHPVSSAVFVLTADSLFAVPLEIERNALEELAGRVSPLLVSPQASPAISAMNFNLTALKELYGRIFAPAEAYLTPGSSLVVVPDGALYGLPFGALVTNVVEPYAYSRADFLIERYPISYELSAQLLRDRPESASEPEAQVLALGRSTFAPASAGDIPALPSSTRPLPDLPAIKQEVQALCRMLDADCRVDAPYQEEAFHSGAGDADVIHLASHALIHAGAPLYSSILLDNEGAAGHDGVLHVYELLRNRIAARLVVLSGCSTAQGQVHAGEGMQGLQYAFRAAGAAGTLSSLWPVLDGHGPVLTQQFYRGLLDEHPPERALQQAQLALLSRSEAGRNPFLWAAPVLYGDPGVMRLPQPPIWKSWKARTLAAFVLLLAAFILYRVNRRTLQYV